MSDKINDKNIVDEMNNSFLDYAMSVIVSRALPDVRDGLKPVHRRILFAMNDLGNYADKPYKKSARIVGDVIGKYHPHGDTSVYSAMVRMAQDFSYRNPLVDGHGNFGSLDGDGAAAMRYTEARMSKIAMELIKDLNKDTIDFQENYDGSELEPVVMPARFPNLLVNGASGIAVGMATNIPPHNLSEVIAGIIEYIENNDIELDELMKIIKGPDFPLGAQILGNMGIKKAYTTGNGGIKVRSKCDIIYDKKEKPSIIVREIPFQVNKSSLVEKIADVVKNKLVEGITDLRDESDRDGVRIVIELSRGTTPEIVLNNLFKNTQLENSFSINLLALVNGEPKVLNLKEMIKHYFDHQVVVTVRKTKYELSKAEERAHTLEGLKIALDNIDEVIAIIKTATTQDDAQTKLETKFNLSEKQAKSILDMQFKRLTGLERTKIEKELCELIALILELKAILESQDKINSIIKTDLIEIDRKYGSPRRSEIIEGYIDSTLDYESLIEEEDVIITLTSGGYIKRIASDIYRTQNRGGKGIKGMNVNEEDLVTNVLVASTHSDLMFFTTTGQVFKIRAHKIPEFSRTAKGIPLQNLISLQKKEAITNILSLKEYPENSYLMFVTKYGIGKKTKLSEYERINVNGKRAINLNDGDEVNSVFTINEDDCLFIASKKGKALVANQESFRSLGRTSTGVRALKLDLDDEIIGSEIINPGEMILTITENGFGKATTMENYRIQNRGGKGVKNINVNTKNGNVVSAKKIKEKDFLNKDILIITKEGIVMKMEAEGIKVSGRATQGVTMMRMNKGDAVANVEIMSKNDEKVNFDVSRETIEKKESNENDVSHETLLKKNNEKEEEKSEK
ncbi:MAG: DNA gyrase subunit A [Mycoplasmatales bacterium]